MQNKAHWAALLIVLVLISVAIGNAREKLFCGTLVAVDDVSRVLIVKNSKRQMEFLVTGAILDGRGRIDLREIRPAASLSVTYTRRNNRFVALRIVVKRGGESHPAPSDSVKGASVAGPGRSWAAHINGIVRGACPRSARSLVS